MLCLGVLSSGGLNMSHCWCVFLTDFGQSCQTVKLAQLDKDKTRSVARKIVETMIGCDSKLMTGEL